MKTIPHKETNNKRIISTVALLLTPVMTFLFLHLTNIPLGIPSEWVWSRISWTTEDFRDGIGNLGLVCFVGLMYAILAVRRLMFFQKYHDAKPFRSLLLLLFVSFIWLSMLQETPPAGKGLRLEKVPLVLYSRSTSGYFDIARHQTEEGTAKFLATYEQRMAKGDVLHEGTHPPGLILMHQCCISLCHQSPAFTEFILNPLFITLEAEKAFGVLQYQEGVGFIPLPREDMAAIWLAGMITQLLAVASMIPLFYLLRRFFDIPFCWKVVVFVPLIPAVAIFLPKSDLLIPMIGMSFLCCWLSACDRQSWSLAMLAGIIFWIGMLISLAILPVGLLAVLLTVWEYKFSPKKNITANMKQATAHQTLKPLLKAVLFAVIGFAGVTALMWLFFHINLLNVWWWNYKNHGAFYSQYSRTYWKWLLVNPVELCFAIGLPLTVAVIAGVIDQLKNRNEWWQTGKSVLFGTLTVWGLLWLSGKNSGEAARLWLVIEIWFVWLLCYSPMLRTGSENNTDDASMTISIKANRQWFLLLICQLIACLLTVTAVTGFTYGNG